VGSTLRSAFLPYTLRNAARLPFYQEFWKGLDVEAISSIAKLATLPTLSKAKYRESFMFDESAVSEAEYITHTTGTTGPLTWRHRSANEAATIQELFGRDAERPDDRSLALVVGYNHHGMAMPVPGPVRGVPIDVTDDLELRQSVRMLGTTYHFADGALQPDVLVGGGHDIALLGQAWLEYRSLAEVITIRVLHLLGYVDSGLRRFLHTLFSGPAILERYSLTGIFGGATRHWPSPNFALDPHVIGEVVDDQGRPVQVGGVGELVLTELFPLVQMQPLVRYRTGDMVLLENDDGTETQFRWWGRRKDCVIAKENGVVLLGYGPVADWLSLRALVARQSHRPWLPSVVSTDLGPPCVALSLDPAGIVNIDIGLRVNPWWDDAAVQALADELWAALPSLGASPLSKLPVRLSFRHVPSSTVDFNANPGGAARRFEASLLSDPMPPFSYVRRD
jgi:hypothetical protein